MGIRLDPAILRRMWPKAPQSKIDSICKISEEVFRENGIDDNYVVAQLMGNTSHENGAGTIVRESGNYRADRIVEIFGSPHSSAAVTPREAQALAHHAEALFERVYNLPCSPKLAKDLGNYLPGDGYKFRGAGDMQTTGRAAMAAMAKRVGRPELAENPDLLEDPELSFRVACAEFKARGCIPLARQRKTAAVRRKINGGTNGMSEVQVWVRRWETALPDIDEPVKIPRGADTGDKKLTDSSIIKGCAGTATATGGAVLSQIGQATQTASDTATTVQTTIDTVHNTVDTATTVAQAVHPFLGLMPQVWIGIGIACGVGGLIGCAYIAWKRYLKYRDEGV
jgi:predicted chitinase